MGTGTGEGLSSSGATSLSLPVVGEYTRGGGDAVRSVFRVFSCVWVVCLVFCCFVKDEPWVSAFLLGGESAFAGSVL